MTTPSKKITKATFKAFIKKNLGNLYIRKKSSFDGMTDGVEYDHNPQFVKVDCSNFNLDNDNTYGLKGVWLVNSSNNYFTAFDSDEYTGISVYNCCGSFDLVIKK